MSNLDLQEFPDDNAIYILTGINGSGKTRALELLSNDLLKAIQNHKSRFKRLICLSGTVLDRFPKPIIESDLDYLYFGRKTNNNMFSEISPFRRIAQFFLDDFPEKTLRTNIVSEFLKKIGLESSIFLQFRRGRNTKEKSDETLTRDMSIKINLTNMIGLDEIRKNKTREDKESLMSEYLTLLRSGKIHLSGLSFYKNGKEILLSDLSSGERGYALAILATAFGTIDNSAILFDEPENSLHPKWQSEIIRDLWEIISLVSKNSILVFATHSPLMISGTANAHTFVKNLETSRSWERSDMFGNSSDSVLREQFGLWSPRSLIFMNLLQKCLAAAVTVNTAPDNFKKFADELLSQDIFLHSDDPLFDTFEQIKAIRERV